MTRDAVFFLNISNLGLVESVHMEPMDWGPAILICKVLIIMKLPVTFFSIGLYLSPLPALSL